MGYSNNKWRKILTILMIINLCFILFAKFSKVFASDSSNYYINDDIYIPSWASDYNYFCKYRSNGNNSFLFLAFTQDNYFTAHISDSNLYIDNRPIISYTVSASKEYIQNYLNSVLTTEEDFNDRWSNKPANSVYTSQPLSTDIISCNCDVKDTNGNIIYEDTTFAYPFFTNNTEIEQCSFTDGIYINPGDFANTDNIYFHLLQINDTTITGETSFYYYTDKLFKLNKDSNYYRTYVDPDIDLFYYYIPKYKLGLSQNSSYLYVLNNSNNEIENSTGLITMDTANGIYSVVESDTTGVITATEEQIDRMKDIQSTITENNERIDNIDDSLSNTTVNQDTETDINGSLSFNNSTPQFSNLFNSYFSRLTSLVADLGNYEDNNVITINLPVPHSNSTIPIRSDMLSSHIPADIYFIIQMVWFFIFGRYYLKFLLKVYHLVSTGLLLDYYSLSGEVITQDML